MKPRLFAVKYLLINVILMIHIISPVTIRAQIPTYSLQKVPEKSIIRISEIGASDITYIPLENSSESIIPRISRILFARNYILTQQYTNVNMFHLDGSFVTKVGTEGLRSNEFTVIHDIDINPTNGAIYIVDGWQQKFLIYDKNGKFIKTFNYPLKAAINFRFASEGILTYNFNILGNINQSFILLDTIGKIIKKFPNKYLWRSTGEINNYFMRGENLFYRYNGKLITKEIYSDTLYEFRNRNFRPYMVINAGEFRLTPRLRTEPPDSINKKIFIPINLFECHGFVYYEFAVQVKYNNESFGFIGLKKNNSIITFDASKGLINDLDGGPNIIPKTVKDNNILVAWVDALQLKSHVASEEFRNSRPLYPEKKKELENLANSLKETDNPVLVLVRLKK